MSGRGDGCCRHCLRKQRGIELPAWRGAPGDVGEQRGELGPAVPCGRSGSSRIPLCRREVQFPEWDCPACPGIFSLLPLRSHQYTQPQLSLFPGFVSHNPRCLPSPADGIARVCPPAEVWATGDDSAPPGPSCSQGDAGVGISVGAVPWPVTAEGSSCSRGLTSDSRLPDTAPALPPLGPVLGMLGCQQPSRG